MTETSLDVMLFEKPWHAQLFALTVKLNSDGCFLWSDWTKIFGATLQTHGLSETLNGGDDYFAAWLDAFEQLLCQIDLTEPAQVDAMCQAWAQAYLETPHGHPVKLADKL
ncbi:MAG: nitrile hydratase accessory protein [Paracoccaceae bacterium]|jgi:nitrile hydratase accessory protein|nr:nitrile hydratase accessory protein [Paracoccaceae bacterium]